MTHVVESSYDNDNSIRLLVDGVERGHYKNFKTAFQFLGLCIAEIDELRAEKERLEKVMSQKETT